MDRIFHHDDTMYEAETDGYAYSDSKCTVKIPADVLEDLFVRGMIIVDSAGVMYKPISCKTAAKVITVTYATTDTTPTAAKLATVKADPV